MTRSVPEWIGKNDDSHIPLRVRLRVLDRTFGRCANECCMRMITPSMKWQCDHIIALINGGQNRESNLQPLCALCHSYKTRFDVVTKAKTQQVRAAHYGLKKPKGRPMPGTKASGIRKRMSGKVEPW